MARRTYKPVDPVRQMYTRLLVQRLIQKQQAEQEAASSAARQQIQADQERLLSTPEGSWSAAPGARNADVPYEAGTDYPGYGYSPGGDVLYNALGEASPLFDRGRNWASEAEWERYNDHDRLPDWLRVPGSGLGPVLEPSPELQGLREDVGTLRGLSRENLAMRSDSANLLDQLSRAVQYAEEDTASEVAYDEARGVKPVPPGIANIYGPYDASQDRYADAPAQPSMIEEAFPENPQGPAYPGSPGYKWGAADAPVTSMEDIQRALHPDQRVMEDPLNPGKFIPAERPMSWGLSRSGFDAANQYKYNRGLPTVPVGPNPGMLTETRPQQRGSRKQGDLGPGKWTPPTPGEEQFLGWTGEAAPPQQRTAIPQGPSLWDNYDDRFRDVMHSADPTMIDEWVKTNPGLWVQ